MEKVQKQLKNLFSASVKVLNNFKTRLFPTKNLDKFQTREPEIELTKATKTKTKRKIFSLKLREEFLNEIKNEDKNINQQIFRGYFNDQSPSFLVKDLYEVNKNKNYIIVKYLNASLINSRNSVNSKEIPEN